MNYQSSDIQQNIFQMNGGGVQSGIPFNSFVHDQTQFWSRIIATAEDKH